MKKSFGHFSGWLWVILYFVISLSMAACSEPASFPDQLKGRWITDSEQYEDRYIEIDETKIIFGTGEPVPNIFFINSFESRPNGKVTEWIFHCEIKKGESYMINLLYFVDKNSDERVELKNLPQVLWHREEK